MIIRKIMTRWTEGNKNGKMREKWKGKEENEGGQGPGRQKKKKKEKEDASGRSSSKTWVKW